LVAFPRKQAEEQFEMKRTKNPHAVALAALGNSKGGEARATHQPKHEATTPGLNAGVPGQHLEGSDRKRNIAPDRLEPVVQGTAV
jgi:hypothetical protein